MVTSSCKVQVVAGWLLVVKVQVVAVWLLVVVMFRCLLDCYLWL